MIVRELLVRFGFSVRPEWKQLPDQVDNVRIRAERAGDAFRNMLAAFLGVSAIKSIAKTADEMMSMEARIAQLPQTIGDAGAAFDGVAKRASDARQSIDAYGNLYIKLQNAGKDFIKTQEEGLQVTDTLSKALVVGGATAQEQSSAMLQFAQAIGSGVLQGDEMRAMAEAAPQFMDELAKAIGVPRSEIKKMGSDGKLTSKVIIEAVKKMSGVFEEKFKQMPMTISQAITIGGNRWSLFIARLNRKSGTVTSVANFLLKGFDKIEAGLEKMIDFFGGATQTVKFFGIAIASALAPLAAMGLWSIAANPITWIVAGLILLGLVIEDVYQFFTGGESVLGDFITWLRSGTVAATTLMLILTTLAGVLVIVALGFVAAWLAAASGPMLVILAIMALYGAFLYFKDEVFKFMSELWDSITAGFFAMIDSITAAWGKFKSFFTSGVNANVSATTVAGAASSAGGTGAVAGNNQNVTINQTLPPGTAPETAAAAKGATEQAAYAMSDNRAARQMGAYAQ